MAPKRASKQQQQLNVDQYTLLKKTMEHLGKQLNVPGSFWQGRMSEDERDKIYKCTIVDFSLVQKVAPTSSPRMDFKVQEMGIDSTGRHEHSDLRAQCTGLITRCPSFASSMIPFQLLMAPRRERS
jgi:hypothetical protein